MRKKAVMSALIAMLLVFSAGVVYVTNFPGTNPEDGTEGPVLSAVTPGFSTPETGSVGPVTSSSDSSGCGPAEEDPQDDGCDAPPTDECGEEDDGCGTPDDDCGCNDDGCGTPDDDCGCNDDGCGEEDDGCDCPPVDPCGGCTLTIGFWKNHEGSGPQDDEVTPLIAAAGGAIWLGDEDGAKSVEINTAAEARNYLDRLGESSNGINRLYAQLLAAKLNVLNGASDNAVDDTISAADAFLAEHGSADWRGLSADEKQQVNQWKDVLDSYNNGIIGPGHCDS